MNSPLRPPPAPGVRRAPLPDPTAVDTLVLGHIRGRGGPVGVLALARYLRDQPDLATVTAANDYSTAVASAGRLLAKGLIRLDAEEVGYVPTTTNNFLGAPEDDDLAPERWDGQA